MGTEMVKVPLNSQLFLPKRALRPSGGVVDASGRSQEQPACAQSSGAGALPSVAGVQVGKKHGVVSAGEASPCSGDCCCVSSAPRAAASGPPQGTAGDQDHPDRVSGGHTRPCSCPHPHPLSFPLPPAAASPSQARPCLGLEQILILVPDLGEQRPTRGQQSSGLGAAGEGTGVHWGAVGHPAPVPQLIWVALGSLAPF